MQYRGKDTKVTKQSKQNNMVRSVQLLSFNFPFLFVTLGPLVLAKLIDRGPNQSGC